MTDPPRLLDQGADEFEQALLRSVERDAGSRAAELRCVAAVGGATLLAAPATASGATLLGVGLKSAALGVTFGLLASGGLVLAAGPSRNVVHEPSAGSNAAVHQPRSAPMAPPRAATRTDAPVAAERAQLAPPQPISTGAHAVTRELAARAVTAPTPAPAASEFPALAESAPPDRELEREVRLLDSVRQALARGDARSAEQQLERHAREFKHATLQPEALVLRVQALLAERRRAEAELIARRFLAANPTGAHAEHLRQLLAAPR